jgi:DNA repair photolyase
MASPLLPGINDRSEQLAALASASATHGACFFIGGALHLGPNVEPYFYPWLEDERPDLLPSYRRLYRRAYAHSSYVERIKQQVRELRAAYGLSGTPPEPRPTREPAQLDLGL